MSLDRTNSTLDKGIGAGLHNTMQVTPVTLSAGSRQEIPEAEISEQLLRRKTVLVVNEGGGDVYIGGENVGYGAGFGGGGPATCSGITVASGVTFRIDAGRVRMYMFNPNGFDVPVKIMEVS